MDAHRKAMLSSMAKHLFMHQRIKTTFVRAKEARKVVERLITVAKKNDLSARRYVFAILRDDAVLKRIFKEIAPLFADRSGGYTRIIRLGTRRGDGAEMAFLELVVKVKEEEKTKKSKAKKTKKAVDDKKKDKDAAAAGETHKAAPEISPELKEEKSVENVKKERARKEDQNIQQNQNFFKKFFRRKTGM